jgi:CubicO group peptidase (beta-lactamase class C family)
VKHILVLIIFLICFKPSYQAQIKLDSKAEEFRNHYNAKEWSDIYSLLSDDFKKSIKEEELQKFLSKDIYNVFGLLQKNEFTALETKNSFVGYFEKGKLIIHINLAQDGKINHLEFLPWHETNKAKRTSFLSNNKKQNALDSLVDKLVSPYMQNSENSGLSIAVFNGGKRHFYNYGEGKKGEEKICSNKTIFEIGSLTKVFCGVLLAQAIIEKKVKAEDDIRKFLPLANYNNLEINGKPVQLIHLANHSSGLPRIPDDIELQPDYNPLDPYKNYNRQMLFEFIKTVRLISEPGLKNEYSNIGMALLGIILEKVYGKSFDELVQEKIAIPLKMESTAMSLSENQKQFFALGYNSSGEPTPYWNLTDLAAAGGLKSSSADLLLFLEASLNNENETLKLASTPSFTNGNTIGIAWHILKTRQGNTLTWHNGGTFGFSAFMGYVKEKNCAVIVLSNSGNMVDFISLGILKHLQN